MRIFDEVIEEDDELPHDGGEGDFLGLTGGDEALIKLFKDGVEARGDSRGHVEDTAYFYSAAADRSSSSESAAVAVIRSDSGECTDLFTA